MDDFTIFTGITFVFGLLLGGIIGAVLWNCYLHAKANAHEGAWYE
jgi:hypothetical protein